MNKINNFESTKKNVFPVSQNIFSNFIVDNTKIKQESRKNASNIEGNNIGINYE